MSFIIVGNKKEIKKKKIPLKDLVLFANNDWGLGG
jgi:hypothetical protein